MHLTWLNYSDVSQIKYSTKRNKSQYRNYRQKTIVLSKLLTSEAKSARINFDKPFADIFL